MGRGTQGGRQDEGEGEQQSPHVQALNHLRSQTEELLFSPLADAGDYAVACGLGPPIIYYHRGSGPPAHSNAQTAEWCLWWRKN